jgi:hypothetical protein
MARRPVKTLALALIAVLAPALASADSDLRELYLATKAQTMGGASCAIVEDEQAIWLNPAGMAGIPRTQITYASVDLEVSGDTIGQLSNTGAFNNMSVSTLNTLMGKDTYARAQIVPSFVGPGWGFAALADAQGAVLAKNMALPQVEVGYQDTYGVAFGYGTSMKLGGGKRRSRVQKKATTELGGELRIGITGKIMWRRGGYNLLSFSQLININQDTIKALTGNYGIGYGVDLGTQYIYTVNDRFKVSAGAVVDNVGTMAFSASTAAPQPQQINLGLGAKYQLPSLGVRLAYDYRWATTDADWRKKTHLGLAFDIPLFTVAVGLSEMKPAGGVIFDIWIAQITAAMYWQELGATLGDDSERRYLLQAALKF